MIADTVLCFHSLIVIKIVLINLLRTLKWLGLLKVRLIEGSTYQNEIGELKHWLHLMKFHLSGVPYIESMELSPGKKNERKKKKQNATKEL